MTVRSAKKKSPSKRPSTSPVEETLDSSAESAPSRSRSTKRAPSQHRVDALIEATEPLLALFAVCDAVFTEEDALSPEHIRKTVGRVYEEYKRTRKFFDPDFHMVDHLKPRRSARGVRLADR